MEQRELIIIGGGPAGYVAAIRARQLGSNVTLIEGDTLGGTFLNRGCIPIRAFVRGVEFLELSKKAREYGVNLGAVEIDFKKMVARKDTIVRTTLGGVKLLMERNGIEVLKGRGRLISPSKVEVVLEDGSTSSLEASKVILATGTRSAGLPVPGGDSALTTEDALDLSEIPVRSSSWEEEQLGWRLLRFLIGLVPVPSWLKSHRIYCPESIPTLLTSY